MTVLTTFANGGSLKDYRDTLNSVLARLLALEGNVPVGPVLSLSSAVVQAEGNSGTSAFVWTLTLARNGSTASFPFNWTVGGNGSNPANAADFGGTLPSGSGTFAPGESIKTITVLVTGDTAVEPTETFLLTVTASGLNTVTSTGTISNDDNASAPYDILLIPTDSFGVGIYARESQDTDWPNVYQYRTRAPAGVTSDITPLDQAIAPDGNDYLSISEYIGKRWAERTGNKVLLVPHSWNGTSLISPSHSWQVGDALHEAAITRTNAAIAATGGQLKAIFMWESGIANDAAGYNTQGLTKAAAKSALSAAIAHYRSAITGATNVPIMLGGLPPEQIAALGGSDGSVNPGGRLLTDALRETARDTTGVYYTPITVGYSSDNLHLTNAGIRFHGPKFVDLMFDTVAPTINTPSTATIASGGPIGIALIADEYVTWTLSGTDAALFEINRTYGTDGPGYINTTMWTDTLRLVGNANTDYASKNSYAVTIVARDGAGNTTSKALTLPVSQPYGVGDQGPTTLTHQQSLSPTGLGYLPSPYSLPGVKYGAGLNLIQIQTDGAITAISGLTLDGSPATLISTPGGGDVVQTWAVAKGSASTAGVLEIAYTGSRNKFTIMIATLNGTKASPLTVLAAVPNNYHSSPTQNATSATCPTGGIIVGFGAVEPTIIGPVAGATRIDPGGEAFGVYRKTSGFVGVEHNNGFSSLNSFIFEKSV